jgi:ATP-dependent DNA helicase RecG
VPLAHLGLAIADEQHRFGVLQRAALQRGDGRDRARRPVMSATPIPRTLALTLYGDLDVSVHRRAPARDGRPWRRRSLRESGRESAWRAVRSAVASGRQAYVVFPAGRGLGAIDLRAATTMARELADGAPGLRIGLVHGRMRADEKERVMRAFKEHSSTCSSRRR